jgi:hypothetical protein
MIHHLVLLTTKPEVIPTKLEEIMVETRIRLLKIPEVNNLRVGKRVDTTNNPHTWRTPFTSSLNARFSAPSSPPQKFMIMRWNRGRMSGIPDRALRGWSERASTPRWGN